MKRRMLRIKLVAMLSVFTLLSLVLFGFTEKYDTVWSFSDGPPASVSGAPGEGDCTACHSDFKVNTGFPSKKTAP